MKFMCQEEYVVDNKEGLRLEIGRFEGMDCNKFNRK